MLRQSLSLKPSFKIRGNPIVSLRGSFGASWYAETRGRMLRQSLSLKPSFKIRGNPVVSLRDSF